MAMVLPVDALQIFYLRNYETVNQPFYRKAASRMKAYFVKFFKYRGLLSELVSRDLRVKYRRSYLGYLWSLLNPLLMMTVISLVFSHMFRFEIQNFPIYLLTGQILYSFYNEASSLAMMSILNNGALIRKVSLPKYVFPLARVLSSYVNLLFSLVAIAVMLLVTRTPIFWTILLFPLPLIYLLIFAIGMGLILSVLAVFFRDIIHLYSVMMLAWMYLTPIFYPVASLPEFMQNALLINPLYHYITMFRNVLMYGNIPAFTEHAVCLAFGIGSVLIGLLVFKRNQDLFILNL